MPRPIPGARFIACVFAGASLFGGAAAVADASLIGLTQFVAVPASAPGPAPVDPSSVHASAKALAASERKAALALLQPEAAVIPTPRLRPNPAGTESGPDNAG